MPSTTTTITPRVYIACLASYNAGVLFGEWVDIPTDSEELNEAIQDMLGRSRVPHAEEWAFHDYEYCASHFGEHESVDELCAYAQAIEDGHEPEKIDLIIAHHGNDWREHLEDSCAVYENRGDYAFESMGDEVPEHLHSYMNWEHLERDLEMDGLTVDRAPSGTLYYFWFE